MAESSIDSEEDAEERRSFWKDKRRVVRDTNPSSMMLGMDGDSHRPRVRSMVHKVSYDGSKKMDDRHTGDHFVTILDILVVMEKERFTMFWDETSPLSQFYPSVFSVEGVEYCCAEQYMMYHKALLFGDKDTACRILQSRDPEVHKSLGRGVKGYEYKIWDKASRDIVLKDNIAKCNVNLLLARGRASGIKNLPHSQHVHMIIRVDMLDKARLPSFTVKNGDKMYNDVRAQDRSKWRGENRLGQVLTEIRDLLYQQEINRSKEEDRF